MASEKFGKSMSDYGTWERKLRNAGFTDVTAKLFKVPTKPWPKDPKLKEIGKYLQAQFMDSVRAYSTALFSRILGWSHDEIDVLLAYVGNETKDMSIHSYTKVFVLYGRKPVV